MRNSKNNYTRYITNRGKYITNLFVYVPYQSTGEDDGQHREKSGN